jgi:NAD kinase
VSYSRNFFSEKEKKREERGERGEKKKSAKKKERSGRRGSKKKVFCSGRSKTEPLVLSQDNLSTVTRLFIFCRDTTVVNSDCGGMSRKFRNVLVVVKQTPYEQYLQLKAQGKAPVALRWERLKNRYDSHRTCVEKTLNVLKYLGVTYSVIGREELHRGSLLGQELLIAVGGDGTVLNTSQFLDDTIPLVGINSDPTKANEIGVTNVKDERRSKGALCATTAHNVEDDLPKIIFGELSPGVRHRLHCLVRSSYTETRLPPALNDLLVAHPNPASVSRLRLTVCNGKVTPSYQTIGTDEEVRGGKYCTAHVCKRMP